MKTISRPWCLVLWVSLTVFPALLLVCLLWPKTNPSEAPLPSPNGYDDFLRARDSFRAQSVEVKYAPPDELRVYVATNTEALKFIRTGLARQCRVPLEYTQGFITNHLPDLATFKALTRLLVTEGQLADAEGRTNDAARIYLETIRFSHEIARGGLMIDSLVSFSCEAIAMEPLAKIVPRLDAATCREMIHLLRRIEREPESVAAVQKRERLWADQISPVARPFRIIQMIVQTRTVNPLKAALQKAEQKAVVIQRRRRVLLVELAARAYKLEKGKPPEQLEDLVPDYLGAVPLEPGGLQKLDWIPAQSQ